MYYNSVPLSHDICWRQSLCNFCSTTRLQDPKYLSCYSAHPCHIVGQPYHLHLAGSYGSHQLLPQHQPGLCIQMPSMMSIRAQQPNCRRYFGKPNQLQGSPTVCILWNTTANNLPKHQPKLYTDTSYTYHDIGKENGNMVGCIKLPQLLSWLRGQQLMLHMLHARQSRVVQAFAAIVSESALDRAHLHCNNMLLKERRLWHKSSDPIAVLWDGASQHSAMCYDIC